MTESDSGKFKIGCFLGQNGYFAAAQLENQAYRYADFLHEGKGKFIEKTGVTQYDRKVQNRFFSPIVCAG